MKLRWILTFLFTAALGSLLHFLYEWIPHPFVGLFVPVNESVWEHLKLLFWPFLLSCAFLQRGQPQPQRFWGAALAANLLMPPVMTGAYYLLKGGFLVETLPLNLVLYLLSLALGFFLLARWRQKEWAGKALGGLILANGIYAACLILFSIAAPQLPIFLPPR